MRLPDEPLLGVLCTNPNWARNWLLFGQATKPVTDAVLVLERGSGGPEYISGKLLEWASKRGIALQHIQPGQPQQNAYIERYNRTVRHEWLDQHIIENIEEAQDFATQWLWTNNNDRPNMGIGGIAPAPKLKMAA